MELSEVKSNLEAVLFSCGEPVPIARLSLIFAVEETVIERTAEELASEYESGERGIRLIRLNNSLQLCSAPEFAAIISKVIEHRAPPRLTPSALETLAIVAYFQPVTRAYIEQVRGVDSSYTVGSLTDRGMIVAVGKLDAPGRPTLYGTTEAFLRVMGVESIDKLPALPDVSSTDGIEKLRQAIDAIKGRGEQLSLDMSM